MFEARETSLYDAVRSGQEHQLLRIISQTPSESDCKTAIRDLGCIHTKNLTKIVELVQLMQKIIHCSLLWSEPAEMNQNAVT